MHIFFLFRFSFVFGVISTAWTKIIHVDFFFSAYGNLVVVKKSRSILNFVVGCDLLLADNVHIHTIMFVIDRCAVCACIDFILIDLYASKGQRNRQHRLSSLIVHTAALNLFDSSKRVVWIIIAGIIFFPLSLSYVQRNTYVRNWTLHNCVCTHCQCVWEWICVHSNNKREEKKRILFIVPFTLLLPPVWSPFVGSIEIIDLTKLAAQFICLYA